MKSGHNIQFELTGREINDGSGSKTYCLWSLYYSISRGTKYIHMLLVVLHKERVIQTEKWVQRWAKTFVRKSTTSDLSNAITCGFGQHTARGVSFLETTAVVGIIARDDVTSSARIFICVAVVNFIYQEMRRGNLEFFVGTGHWVVVDKRLRQLRNAFGLVVVCFCIGTADIPLVICKKRNRMEKQHGLWTDSGFWD